MNGPPAARYHYSSARHPFGSRRQEPTQKHLLLSEVALDNYPYSKSLPLVLGLSRSLFLSSCSPVYAAAPTLGRVDISLNHILSLTEQLDEQTTSDWESTKTFSADAVCVEVVLYSFLL